jgi:hypothetical protein
MLNEWMSEKETAAQAGKTVRTLRQWRRQGKGPPYAHFGRTIKYRRTSYEEHYRASEINPVRNKVSNKRGKKAAEEAGLTGRSAQAGRLINTKVSKGTLTRRQRAPVWSAER